MSDLAFQRCINPLAGRPSDLADTAFRCPKCGGLLDVAYDWDRLPVPKSLRTSRASGPNRSDPLDFSGVWRFRELFPSHPTTDPDHRRGADALPAGRRGRALRRH